MYFCSPVLYCEHFSSLSSPDQEKPAGLELSPEVCKSKGWKSKACIFRLLCAFNEEKGVLFSTTGPYTDSREAYFHMVPTACGKQDLAHKEERRSRLCCKAAHHYSLAGLQKWHVERKPQSMISWRPTPWLSGYPSFCSDHMSALGVCEMWHYQVAFDYKGNLRRS